MDNKNGIGTFEASMVVGASMLAGAAATLLLFTGDILYAEDGVIKVKTSNYTALEDVADFTVNDYNWSFNGKEYTMSLPISHSMIKAAKYEDYNHSYVRYNKNNEAILVNGADYSKYIDSDIDSSLVRACAENLEKIAEDENFSETDTANFVLAFVQSIEYRSDSNGNYCQHTCETLYRKTGDCEDKSVAYADIMNDMGYSSIVLEFPGHAIPAVAPKTEGAFSGVSFEADGVRYYLAESTAEGSSVGVISEQYYDEKAIYYSAA
ncbi:MAG: hypothetical protein IJZ72_04820 [Oscillospiraceae bacterium]|nr:hypothetical protein [Oscillospiraceae bacterium]